MNDHGRRSIRLQGFDYSQAGGYFVTMVTQLREPLFGKVCDGEMILNDAGQMIWHEWVTLPERFPNIAIDVFQVMPNHLHAILLIHNPNPVGAGLVPANDPQVTREVGAGLVPAHDGRETTRVAPTVGEIVGAYKSITTHKYIHGVEERSWPVFTKKLWQRNYFEHIIRNETNYDRIAGYILDNPANWEQDNENPFTSHPIPK
jgi:putative transposase